MGHRAELLSMNLVEDFMDLLEVFENDHLQEFLYVRDGDAIKKRII